MKKWEISEKLEKIWEISEIIINFEAVCTHLGVHCTAF